MTIKCKVCGSEPHYSPVDTNAEERWKVEKGWDEGTGLCQSCLMERRNTVMNLLESGKDASLVKLVAEADSLNRAILTTPASE